MTGKQKILFWGELPPNIVHGISLSSKRILTALSNCYNIVFVEDRAAFSGFINIIKYSLLGYFFIFKNAFNQCDIFYLNMPVSRLGLIRVFIAVKIISIFSPKTKVISHLHRGDFPDFFKANKNLCKIFFNEIDLLLVLSEKSKEEVLSCHILDKDKIEVLHNTISLSHSHDSVYSEDIAYESFYCLCNYIDSKRIHSLVSIANDMGINVDFNGTVSNEKYMAYLKELDLNNLCVFGEIVAGEQKDNKLKKAKFVVLPSLNEGMPLVILESLSYGTPVICFDVGYISEYLGSDYLGLVSELSDKAMKDRIEYLNSLSIDDYLELRKQSYDIFWSKFSPLSINQKVINIFKQKKSRS